MKIDNNSIREFETFLREEEKEKPTIEKYLHNVREFAVFINNASDRANTLATSESESPDAENGTEITKNILLLWKDSLLEKNLKPCTINAKIVSINRFLRFLELHFLCLKTLRVQRQVFRSNEKELTRVEYERLVNTAGRMGKTRTALLIETICATGIRVSEVKYVTVAALQAGRLEISLKGKIRTILIPEKLCRKLKAYAKSSNIASGNIFRTKNGNAISRSQIWHDMKIVCMKAGISPAKVFPHNLRHLFARTFYTVSRDIVKLADVLGHSTINTTRLYLISTGREHERLMEKLRLVS